MNCRNGFKRLSQLVGCKDFRIVGICKKMVHLFPHQADDAESGEVIELKD